MSGTPLSASEILARFNSIVRNQASAIDNATWYAGNFPEAPLESRLGPQNEAVHSAAEISSMGQLAATVVFNILHGFAMELTRVRLVQAWHRTDAAPIDGGLQRTALNTNYAAYFPIPYQPTVGEVVTDAILNSFLSNLRDRVNIVRDSGAYAIDIVTCHSSCHSNCHSSRNRR
jgi:hypothetical protein